jgi:hypothetical protein
VVKIGKRLHIVGGAQLNDEMLMQKVKMGSPFSYFANFKVACYKAPEVISGDH